ncbi:MAG: hypothetical protein ACXAEU_13350 [Candidatus Hodarchaeales archaeon]|jgi:hypothetical protein
MPSRKISGARDQEDELEEVRKHYKSNYYEVIKAKTLSRRGNWWTALLLVEEKKEIPKKKRKVIFQRWRRMTQTIELDGKENKKQYWRKEKDFTLSNPKHWNQLKSFVDSWINTNEWE